jgi:hypothetical protein
LRKAIKSFFLKIDLSEREKCFLEKYYGLEGSEEGQTLQKIGDAEGLTRERIRQIIEIATNKIRASDELGKLALLHYGDNEDADKIIRKVNQAKAKGKKELEQKSVVSESEIFSGYQKEVMGSVRNKKQIIEDMPEYFRMISVLNLAEISIQKIIQKTSYFFGFDEQSLLSRSRYAPMVLVRQIVMYVLHERKKISFPEIARLLKMEDHTTILHGCRKIKKHIESSGC